jgi:hypothetical protein
MVRVHQRQTVCRAGQRVMPFLIGVVILNIFFDNFEWNIDIRKTLTKEPSLLRCEVRSEAPNFMINSLLPQHVYEGVA